MDYIYKGVLIMFFQFLKLHRDHEKVAPKLYFL